MFGFGPGVGLEWGRAPLCAKAPSHAVVSPSAEWRAHAWPADGASTHPAKSATCEARVAQRSAVYSGWGSLRWLRSNLAASCALSALKRRLECPPLGRRGGAAAPAAAPAATRYR